MERMPLGNTGLMVSRAGLGCGGNSRLGLQRGASQNECVALVREAIDLGVNFLDTAQDYGTESVVGDAVAQVPRDSVVISTKAHIRRNGELIPAAQFAQSIDSSLKTMRLETIDIFNLHAVLPEFYDYALSEITPVLLKARQAGKIRHLGVTESSPRDPEQQMLHRAIHDEPWEVVMLAFNMMNQGARRELLPTAKSRGIGTLIMFAVRNVFSQPEVLAQTLQRLADQGKLPAEYASTSSALDFLVHANGASSITDAAYRYVLHQPGANVVLFGTGSSAHLRTNIESLSKPALPAQDVAKLHELYSHLIGIGLDLPDHKQQGAAQP